MTDRKIRTLAYTKSPKASRRTTFQDELEAAVSSRSSKKTTAQYSYSDEFDEDDNDFLKDLLKSRKKRNALAAMKKMAKMNDFELSDDEGEKSRPKRVSFLKTQRVVTSSQDIMAPDSQQDEHLPEPSNSNQNDSSDSQLSQSFNKEHSKSAASDMSDMDRTHSQSTSLPLQSESGIMESPLLPESSELRRDSVHEEGSEANSPQPLETSSAHISTDGTVERELPTPKPRARTRALRSQGIVDLTEDTGTPQSRAMTSSVSIPLSSDTASNSTTSPRRATSRSCSLPVPERDQSDSINSSQARTERSRSLTISTVDSGTKDYHTSDDSKAHEGKYSMSFEEFHEHSEEHLDHSISRLSHGPENSPDTRTPSLLIKCPRRSQSACSSKVKSKYMGTLKVLDRKMPGEDSQPEAADSLRAAIYQEWLQKKKEKLRENMQLKTQEDNLKEEKKKKQEQDKREHAIASYNAWKEKKSETLKEKAKQKHATIRKEQRAIEEKEEKKEAAKKMFEKWKQEHDELLKEKYRQQKGAESKHKQKKQHTEEERKKDSNSAFSDWKEKKKTFVMEKITEERKENKNKAEEETYLKEEKDKMALEMYEKWLIKKEREQRRQREERKIQAILEDEPPPPWSPPNKTIPFRK